MRLYVVNCTGQNRAVNYRLDYTVDDLGRRTSEKLVPYRTQLVPARQQMPFGGDWHPLQIQDIVEQLEKTHGAVNAINVRTAKRMGVVKMIWQEDKPVSRPICEDVMAHNMGLLSEQGATRRRQLALVADQQLANLIDKPVAKMEMEFEQVEEDADLPTSRRLEEGLRVRHESHGPAEPAKRRTRRAA